MLTLQSWIPRNPASLDVITPIKARACSALNAVLKSRPIDAPAKARLMPRGAERC
ncbi:hypothetical protein [Mycobacterium parmense]|uniref:Uncharacterized protein n=1 Tax=Mycobacterium parmense TaxID=185642 RepID=A0A7I7YXT0_9MYCO|nr:hypothetical protein [Mycobacterium parmense]MCV7349979.1 hypothetical protein [Mycobacterium parmense]BBZ46489.1 hypothetical protein MPRM_37700 [Mycobacterium parmense]